MASDSQHARENLVALRAAKRAERALDSAIEKVERELVRLRSRKTRIKADELEKLIRLWDGGVRPRFGECEHALADFSAIVSY